MRLGTSDSLRRRGEARWGRRRQKRSQVSDMRQELPSVRPSDISPERALRASSLARPLPQITANTLVDRDRAPSLQSI